MRFLAFAAVAALSVSAPCFAQGPVYVPPGTRVTLYPSNNISGNSLKVGDRVYFTAATPVQVNNVAVVAVNAPARGTVLKVRHSSAFGKAGELQISIDEIQAVDGSILKLRSTADGEGQSRAAMSIGMGVMGDPTALLMQGQDASVPTNRLLEVYVDEGRTVQGVSLMSALGGASSSIVVPDLGKSPSMSPFPSNTSPPPPPTATGYSFPGDTVTSRGKPVFSANPPRPASPPAPPKRTGIANAMFCEKVTSDGVPLMTGSSFSAALPSVSLWFGVDAAQADRVYEVRWYRNTQLYYTGSAIVRAFQTSAHSTLIASGANGFTPGKWSAVILANGRVELSKTLVLKPTSYRPR